MTIPFFNTVMGHRFIEGVMPNMLKQLIALNKNLAEFNANFKEWKDLHVMEKPNDSDN